MTFRLWTQRGAEPSAKAPEWTADSNIAAAAVTGAESPVAASGEDAELLRAKIGGLLENPLNLLIVRAKGEDLEISLSGGRDLNGCYMYLDSSQLGDGERAALLKWGRFTTEKAHFVTSSVYRAWFRAEELEEAVDAAQRIFHELFHLRAPASLEVKKDVITEIVDALRASEPASSSSSSPVVEVPPTAEVETIRTGSTAAPALQPLTAEALGLKEEGNDATNALVKVNDEVGTEIVPMIAPDNRELPPSVTAVLVEATLPGVLDPPAMAPVEEAAPSIPLVAAEAAPSSPVGEAPTAPVEVVAPTIAPGDAVVEEASPMINLVEAAAPASVEAPATPPVEGTAPTIPPVEPHEEDSAEAVVSEFAAAEPMASSENGSSATSGLLDVPLAKLVDDETNVRQDVGDLTLLRASITQDELLHPLLLRPRPDRGEGMYGVVAGKRRWMTLVQLAQEQGKSLDAVTVPARIRSMNDVEALLVSTKENLARHDLTPRELYEALERLKMADPDRFGTYESLGQVIGKDRKYVERLYAAVEVELATGTVVVRQERRKSPGLARELPLGHAQRLVETVRALDLPDDARKEKMRRLVQAITGLTRRRAEALFAQFLRNPEVDIGQLRQQVVDDAPKAHVGPFRRSYASEEVAMGLSRASSDYPMDTTSLVFNIVGAWLEARGYLRPAPPASEPPSTPPTEPAS